MKKTLLSLAAFSFFAFASAQAPIIQDYNTLIIGNVGTDFTGATAGQGSQFTLATNGVAPTTSVNAGNDNFQIVAGDAVHGNVLQITGPDGNKGGHYIFTEGLEDYWDSRTAGNDILEMEYSFYTGDETTSKNHMRSVLYNSLGDKMLAGISFAMDTKILSALMYYTSSSGTSANYLVNFVSGGLVLEPSTWYTLGVSYNSITGQVTIKEGNDYQVVIQGAAPNDIPGEFDFWAAPGGSTAAPNMSATVGLFDNLVLKTVSSSDPLGLSDNVAQKTAISVYPNPASDVVNIAGTDRAKVTFADINGRTVKSLTINANQASISISDLASGLYMMTIETADGASTTKKLLKK